MRQFLKYTLALFAMLTICTPDAGAKRKAKQREEIIVPEKGYAYELASPAASMVVDYNGKVKEEFIFEDGQSVPSMRIIREFKSKGFEDDTLSYDASGKIVRVGKYRNFDIKKRVEYFDDRNSYHVKYILPGVGTSSYNPASEMRLTDFDSHGNWTKAYYKNSEGKKPAIIRKITYELTPEQEAMLAANKATAQGELQMQQDIWAALKVIGIGILMTCVALSLLAFFLKNACSGHMRWVIWLICGIPLASVAFLYGMSWVDDNVAALKIPFRLVGLAVYMLLMYLSIKAMSKDRRISNGFIHTINIIWSIWAFFIICPFVMSAIMPNFFGRILSWVLGAVLWMINYGYTARRCPVCRNPEGLEFDHRSHEGFRRETNTTTSEKRKNPKVVEMMSTANGCSAKVRSDLIQTRTTTSKMYEMVRDHYVCYECGHVEVTGKMKGVLIDYEISQSTDRSKEVVDINIQ